MLTHFLKQGHRAGEAVEEMGEQALIYHHLLHHHHYQQQQEEDWLRFLPIFVSTARVIARFPASRKHNRNIGNNTQIHRSTAAAAAAAVVVVVVVVAAATTTTTIIRAVMRRIRTRTACLFLQASILLL